MNRRTPKIEKLLSKSTSQKSAPKILISCQIRLDLRLPYSSSRKGLCFLCLLAKKQQTTFLKTSTCPKGISLPTHHVKGMIEPLGLRWGSCYHCHRSHCGHSQAHSRRHRLCREQLDSTSPDSPVFGLGVLRSVGTLVSPVRQATNVRGIPAAMC